MANSSTRRVTIFINGKEVEASVKQIHAKMTASPTSRTEIKCEICQSNI